MVVLVLLALVTHPLVFGDIDHKLVVFSLIVFNVQDRTFSSKWCEQLNVSWMRSCVEIFALEHIIQNQKLFQKSQLKVTEVSFLLLEYQPCERTIEGPPFASWHVAETPSDVSG